MKNVPYVKQYGENGELTNPINGTYSSPHPNRRSRRYKKERFTGNGRNFHLTVFPTERFKRVVQIVTEVVTGSKKRIEHYLK